MGSEAVNAERVSMKYLRRIAIIALCFVFTKVLYDKGHPKQSPIVEAVLADNISDVNRLIAKGEGEGAEYRDYEIVRPLLVLAAERGHYDMVANLLDHGENINISDNWGITPLSMAVMEGHREIAELLLNRGADPNLDHPLTMAKESKDAQMVRLLEEHGAR